MRRRARAPAGAAAAIAAGMAAALAAGSGGTVFAPAGAQPAPPTAAASVPRAAEGYRLAVPPYAFRFPRDHAAHPEYRTEWWYYTGELRSGGRRYGFELTFFRVGLDRARERSRSAWAPHTVVIAHAALTDETAGTFRYDEAAARPALGLAGADTSVYRVWIGDWSAGLAPDGRTHRLAAATPEFSLALELDPRKAPALHGRDGVCRKGAGADQASHYYSITRLAVRGRVAAGRDSLPVEGEAWMDHEFGSGTLGVNQAGWDWFGLRLADGRDLMLYVLRRTDGTTEPVSGGSLVGADGRVTPIARDGFSVTATGRWSSPRSGATYPHGWRVAVPRHGIDVEVTPTADDQELVTRSTGGVTYWEGSVRVRDAGGARRDAGRGYVELTGYAGPPPGR